MNQRTLSARRSGQETSINVISVSLILQISGHIYILIPPSPNFVYCEPQSYLRKTVPMASTEIASLLNREGSYAPQNIFLIPSKMCFYHFALPKSLSDFFLANFTRVLFTTSVNATLSLKLYLCQFSFKNSSVRRSIL